MVRFLRGKKTSQRATLSTRATVQQKKHVIIGIHLRGLFINEGGCKLGNKSAFKHTEHAGGEPKKRNNSVVIAKTLDYPCRKSSHFAEIQR